MSYDWLSRAIVPAAIVLVFALFRRYLPAPPEPKSIRDYKRRQKKEPLPSGAIGATMWGMGILCCLSFFLLRGMNHLWAHMDGPAILRVYQTSVAWCFLPGFSALALPWPVTIALLRRLGRTDEADGITNRSNQKGGYDGYRLMKGMGYFLVAPIAFFTLLAIPLHMSLDEHEARVGHYAHWSTEVFPYRDAVRACVVIGQRQDGHGKSHPTWNLLIDFKDGRRLDASTGQDGGESPNEEVVHLLLQKTGLTPQSVHDEKDIPPLQPALP